MRVQTLTPSMATTPVSTEGAHAVAWATMLDLIYADAFHRGVGSLRFEAGSPSLIHPIQCRADATITLTDGHKAAVAQLVTGESVGIDETIDVVYTVEYGSIAPRHLRRHHSHAPSGWRLAGQYAVFTWKARLLGIPIRMASMLHQPHWFDLLMQRMRRVFVTEQHVAAYYHLKIWLKTDKEGTR